MRKGEKYYESRVDEGRDGILRFLRKLPKNGNWLKRKEGEKKAKSRNRKNPMQRKNCEIANFIKLRKGEKCKPSSSIGFCLAGERETERGHFTA